MADPTRTGQRVLDALAHGRRRAIEQARADAEPLRRAVLALASDDEARGRQAHGRASASSTSCRADSAAASTSRRALQCVAFFVQISEHVSNWSERVNDHLVMQMQERARATSINELGRMHRRRDLADVAIFQGSPLAQFKNALLEEIAPASRPHCAVGLSDSEVRQYSCEASRPVELQMSCSVETEHEA